MHVCKVVLPLDHNKHEMTHKQIIGQIVVEAGRPVTSQGTRSFFIFLIEQMKAESDGSMSFPEYAKAIADLTYQYDLNSF